MKKLKKINFLAIIVFVCSIFWLMPLILIFINSFKPYNDCLLYTSQCCSIDFFLLWIDHGGNNDTDSQ